MKIVKIILEDGTEHQYNEVPFEKYKKHPGAYAAYHYRQQHQVWEEDYILPNLETDLEEWAKEQYDLQDETEEKDISDFSNLEIVAECEKRNVSPLKIANENIINAGFVARIIELSRRGDDRHIDTVLESLEKLYRIK